MLSLHLSRIQALLSKNVTEGPVKRRRLLYREGGRYVYWTFPSAEMELVFFSLPHKEFFEKHGDIFGLAFTPAQFRVDGRLKGRNRSYRIQTTITFTFSGICKIVLFYIEGRPNTLEVSALNLENPDYDTHPLCAMLTDLLKQFSQEELELLFPVLHQH